MRGGRLATSAALGCWVLGFALAAWGDRAEELAALRRAVVGSRERVAAYEREGRGLLEAIEAMDRTLAALTASVDTARRDADDALATLRGIEAEAGELAGKLSRTRSAMAERAVALYKAGEVGAVRLLFSSTGPRQFLSRVSTLRLLIAHDAELLETHRSQSEALARAESEVRDTARRHEAAVASLRDQRDDLTSERRAKRELVARVHEDRTRERAALVELETAARALEETLASLRDAPVPRDAPTSEHRFGDLRGQLPSPVGASIARRFGRIRDSESLTETFHTGVEFESEAGTPVRAVAVGRVRYADWFSGYGRLVILDHGEDFYTVSGHLDEIHVAVGDAVAAGAAIGTVGETGSLRGPNLYFEIRRGAEPLDPRDWLTSKLAR